eukprot:12978-Chlamydomonas_euryale.AAC.6
MWAAAVSVLYSVLLSPTQTRNAHAQSRSLEGFSLSLSLSVPRYPRVRRDAPYAQKSPATRSTCALGERQEVQAWGDRRKAAEAQRSGDGGRRRICPEVESPYMASVKGDKGAEEAVLEVLRRFPEVRIACVSATALLQKDPH